MWWCFHKNPQFLGLESFLSGHYIQVLRVDIPQFYTYRRSCIRDTSWPFSMYLFIWLFVYTLYYILYYVNKVVIVRIPWVLWAVLQITEPEEGVMGTPIYSWYQGQPLTCDRHLKWDHLMELNHWLLRSVIISGCIVSELNWLVWHPSGIRKLVGMVINPHIWYQKCCECD